MEAAVVSVATGVMTPLLSKLAKLLGDEYVKLKGVRKQIQFLIDELSAMNATLEMLADEEHLNPEMKDWRDKLREMAYDIEDCVDTFIARVDRDGSKGFKGFVRKMKSFKVRYKIGNEIEELKKRVADASERHKRYSFVPSANNSSTSTIDPRLSVLYEDIKNLVAIDNPKKHIIERLNMEKSSSAKVEVVSIYGCGGLGKTTLAKQVYDSIKGQFSCSAFVSVSQNPNWIKILRDIAKGVGVAENTQDDDVTQLIDKLRMYLHDKRYFIVIDDIWEEKHWEPLNLALSDNNCGSRITTTTRSATVATTCSSQGGYAYEMKPLSFDDSKKLFFKRAFGSENTSYPYLEDVPDRILRKCGGLPLAIITVASMLTNKHEKAEWDRVLCAIGSKLAKRVDAEKMTSILSLSYTNIPHHLRTCLLYLSLFPEDYEIEKQHLINRWTAEGFIPKEQERSAYEIGESYFNELINRCMIQPVDVKYDQANACRVHDIILDYIKCKAAEENFVVSLDALKNISTSEYKIRRLCVSNRNGESSTRYAGPSLSHVRSFTVFGQPVQISFMSFTALRVLDLGGCWATEDHHLASIEKLIHLKYLRLSGLITMLPVKIGELEYLQTLDIQGTNIKELPMTITKLQQLAHLYVDSNTKISEGMIRQMHSLQELSEYGVGSYEQAMSLQEFSKLTKLTTLNIRWDLDLPNGSDGIRQSKDIQSSVGALLCARNLHNLHVYISSDDYLFPVMPLDSLHFTAPCILRELSFEGCFIYKVPSWMGTLGNLLVLELHIICLRPEDVEILGTLPSLSFFKLGTAGGSKGKIVLQGSSGFRNLKYFYLHMTLCGTSLEFEAGSMPKLEHLKLWFHVHKMECLNSASYFGIQHLSALSKVEIRIGGNCDGRYDYDPSIDTSDSTVSCVASAIKASTETLPKRPTLSFETDREFDCCRFECALRELNQDSMGTLTEWLKVWDIEEEQTREQCLSCICVEKQEKQTEQATHGETEVVQKDDTGEEEE